ncbi:hypothetical protein APY03_5031 [Variovorax sp. WDL1]|nr:hypothetical protein APY03_5031 [Variovorax sp. WDL1]
MFVSPTIARNPDTQQPSKAPEVRQQMLCHAEATFMATSVRQLEAEPQPQC